jgi:hypothetical protein
MTTKSVSIKDAAGKSGGRVWHSGFRRAEKNDARTGGPARHLAQLRDALAFVEDHESHKNDAARRGFFPQKTAGTNSLTYLGLNSFRDEHELIRGQKIKGL